MGTRMAGRSTPLRTEADAGEDACGGGPGGAGVRVDVLAGSRVGERGRLDNQAVEVTPRGGGRCLPSEWTPDPCTAGNNSSRRWGERVARSVLRAGGTSRAGPPGGVWHDRLLPNPEIDARTRDREMWALRSRRQTAAAVYRRRLDRGGGTCRVTSPTPTRMLPGSCLIPRQAANARGRHRESQSSSMSRAMRPRRADSSRDASCGSQGLSTAERSKNSV